VKIITPKQMRDLEQQAIRDGASENDFMEEAGSGVGLVVHEFVERFGLEHQAILICGKGNNAGDGYVTGIHLLHLDYHVHAYQLFPLSECSPLCQSNAARFVEEGGILTEVGFDTEVFFPLDGVIIDAIFGTGFRGDLDQMIMRFIRVANVSGLPIISVDIPSGLNGETGEIGEAVILAAETAFLALPKQGFFLLDGWNAVGKLRAVDFGLDEEYIEELPEQMEMLNDEMMLPILPMIKRTRSKYESGYVVGVAGSSEMPGAAILSATATLKGGAGIVRLLYPQGMEVQLSGCTPEVIKTPVDFAKPDTVLEYVNKAAAFYIGPGLGKSPVINELLAALLPKVQVPTVIDADALNSLAEKWVKLPEKTILTPHMGEMRRLLHLKAELPLDTNLLTRCQRFAEDKNATVILKGAPTFIFHPGLPIHISPCGDPGLATAGTGDVLTGLIASFLAQGLTPHQAACLGVYIHGIAGEQAALELTSYCMTASDLFDFFPSAFSFATY
jgi:hydroxyethylthiazole kinase-like uncharacterized protein yjeF